MSKTNNSPIFLKNATYIDWKTLDISQTDILVEPGLNGSIKFTDSPPENAIVLDLNGKLVTKSFAIAHHHIYSALAVGMPAPPKTPTNFYQILQYVWWRLDKALDKDMILASALSTAIYAAKRGATFIIDHHASPNYIKGSLNIIAQALDQVGLSHILCYEITDRNGHDQALEGIEESAQYLRDHQGLIGLHASFTLEDSTLKKVAELMSQTDSGVHIHVAEDKFDEDFTTYRWNKRVIHRLKDFGFLDSSKTIIAHALHLNDEERMILRMSKAWLVQNPMSNLNNKVGFFNSYGLPKARIMLGTDGMHSDMLKSLLFSYYAGLTIEPQDMLESYQRLRNVHSYIQQNSFKGDGPNNLIVLDYSPRTPLTKQNFIGHLFFGISSADIIHVISRGKLIVKDRQITTVNEQEIMQFAQEQAKRLWNKLLNS